MLTAPRRVRPISTGAEPAHGLIDLRRAEVHIWLVEGLDAGDTDSDGGWPALTADERATAANFARPEDRRQSGAARVAVRSVLARYLRCDPAEVPLARDARGRTVLEHGSKGLVFSISHCSGVAACAVALGPVGVDVERRGDWYPTATLVDRVCSSRERIELSGLSAIDRRDAFLRIWVRKEGLLKAIGTGLDGSLAAVDVSGSGVLGAPVGGKWRIEDLPAPEGCFAAVAARGSRWHPRLISLRYDELRRFHNSRG